MKSYTNIAGLFMVSIVLYHIGRICKHPGAFQDYVFALNFSIPWFFFKSGISFSPKTSKNDIIRNLLSPYVAFTIIGYLVHVFYLNTRHDLNWKYYVVSPVAEVLLKGAVSGNSVLWFLLALFFCHVIYRKIYSFVGDSIVKNLLLVLVCVLVAWGCNVLNINRPLYLANTFCGLAFFVTGYCIKTSQYDTRILCLSILTVIVFLCTTVPCVAISSNTLWNGVYPCYFLYAIACCIVVDNLFLRLPICNKLLLYIGTSSYIIYVSHWIIITAVLHTMLSLFPECTELQLFWPVLVFSTILLIFICVLNNKYGGMKFLKKNVVRHNAKI